VAKAGGNWHYIEVISKEDKTEIASLFDAFKKQIRTGYFTLPNALISSEVK